MDKCLWHHYYVLIISIQERWQTVTSVSYGESKGIRIIFNREQKFCSETLNPFTSLEILNKQMNQSSVFIKGWRKGNKLSMMHETFG